MAEQAYVAVNDYEPSWADIGITITPLDQSVVDVTEISAIKWGRKRTIGKRKGVSGGRVTARTRGESEFSGSITLYRSGWRKLIRALMENAPTRGEQRIIGEVPFDILIHHSPPGDDEIYSVKMKGCLFLEDSSDMAEGPDPDKIEVVLDVIEVVNIIDGVEVAIA